MTPFTSDEFRRLYVSSQAPKLGWGKAPALLIVDFIEGFTHPGSSLSGDWAPEIEATQQLLSAVRLSRWPVFFTTVEFDPEDEILLARKSPRVKVLLRGSRWTRVDRRLAPRLGEVIVSKKQGSAFFDTTLAEDFAGLGVDTVLICGCVTSGCIRATAVDCAQHGFIPLIVRECVGDRSPLAQQANLLDIEQRYGDVVSLAEVLQRTQELKRHGEEGS